MSACRTSCASWPTVCGPCTATSTTMQRRGRAPATATTRRKRYREVFTSTVYETEHPLVRVHPETGEHTLVLGNFVQKIVGYSRDEFRAAVRHLPGSHHAAGEHRALAAGAGRRRDLGQPRDAALRGQRLRQPAPPGAPDDACRGRAGERR